MVFFRNQDRSLRLTPTASRKVNKLWWFQKKEDFCENVKRLKGKHREHLVISIHPVIIFSVLHIWAQTWIKPKKFYWSPNLNIFWIYQRTNQVLFTGLKVFRFLTSKRKPIVSNSALPKDFKSWIYFAEIVHAAVEKHIYFPFKAKWLSLRKSPGNGPFFCRKCCFISYLHKSF